MNPGSPFFRTWLVFIATVPLAACTEETPLAPAQQAETTAQFSNVSQDAHLREAEVRQAVATLRRATDRYHRIENALADGFVFLHECEVRPEGPVGTVYVHPGRLTDGIDTSLPDALIYEPKRNGRARLVGVELVIPYSLWTEQSPPEFLGKTFQPEDEFGVFGLHVWVWRHNPLGLFAEVNPRVSCEIS